MGDVVSQGLQGNLRRRADTPIGEPTCEQGDVVLIRPDSEGPTALVLEPFSEGRKGVRPDCIR